MKKNISLKTSLLAPFLLAAAWIGMPLHAVADPTPATRLEQFVKQRQFGVALLSPDQEHLAVTTSVNGRLHLAAVDLETRKVTPLAGFTDADVCSIRWINNNRLIFQLSDKGKESRNSTACRDGMFAINRDGSRMAELAPTIRKQIDQMSLSYGYIGVVHYYSFIDTYSNDAGEIVITEHLFGEKNEVGLFKLNTFTGRKREFLYNISGTPEDFVLDNKQELRAIVIRGAGEKSRIVWYRDEITSPWRKLVEIDPLNPELDFAGMDADNKTIYISSRNGGDRWGIYKYDLARNKPGEKIADDAAVDVDGPLIFDENTHKLLGIRVFGEPSHTQWLDRDFADIQETIDSIYPDRINVLSGNPKNRVLVYSYSSTLPGEYSLYDPQKKKLEHLFNTRPWIKSDQMSDQLIFDYTARDGLHIPAYLTIPKGKPLKALPLIVMPHGGPSTRDYWAFDPYVQFLANLGYAVLQPQFRGSVGYGWNHYTKGWKQWGLTMQDDISDGVQNLVKQGIVDSKRVCIMGASYGGYATLMGLVKDPDQYRCGIDLLGVSDIGLLFTEGRWSDDDDARYEFNVRIGDPSEMKAQFEATSPSRQAAKIRAPVLMAYGAKDRRVPLKQGERMRDALKAQGKTVEWMEFADEEHGFTQEANRYKLFGAIEKFLKTYNPAD